MNKQYRIEVYRDGRWWMIRVPELDNYVDAHGSRFPEEALTQARRYSDIEREAVDFICTVTDAAPSTVSVEIAVHIGEGEDLVAQAHDVIALKARSATLEREALTKSKYVAQKLAGRGVPVRDIGAILGVTHQRADQLIKSSPALGISQRRQA